MCIWSIREESLRETTFRACWLYLQWKQTGHRHRGLRERLKTLRGSRLVPPPPLFNFNSNRWKTCSLESVDSAPDSWNKGRKRGQNGNNYFREAGVRKREGDIYAGRSSNSPISVKREDVDRRADERPCGFACVYMRGLCFLSFLFLFFLSLIAFFVAGVRIRTMGSRLD